MVTAEIIIFFTTCHWSVMITTAEISLVNITSAEISLVSITPAGILLVSITPAGIIIIIMNVCKAPTYHWRKLAQVKKNCRATNICHDKSFVDCFTFLICCCCGKHNFVVASILLSRQNTSFVATKSSLWQLPRMIPTLRLKALNKDTNIMYIEMEKLTHKVYIH